MARRHGSRGQCFTRPGPAAAERLAPTFTRARFARCAPSPLQVDSEVAALKASLSTAEAALKEAEEALLPPRLARLARTASGHISAQWAELQSSPTFGAAATRANEVAAQVAAQAGDLASKVKEQVGPYASEAYARASTLARSASIKASEVQSELTTVVDSQMRAVPALAPYADPVVVQAVVFGLMGAPVLLLLPLLSLLLGGKRGGGDDGRAAKKAAAGGAAKAKAGAAKPAAKPAKRALA